MTPFARLARAPLRVSLAGGGTDLPSYASLHSATVISFAINRYVAVSLFPRSFDASVRACWENVEHVGAVDRMRNQFAVAALRRTGVHRDIQLASHADAPSGTGLGSSGSFTVALLHALRGADGVTPTMLAEEASEIEMIDLDRPVGKHDQYMAAFGGLRVLHIAKDLTVHTEPLLVLPHVRAYVEDRLLLFYTGLSRDAGHVLTAQDHMTKHGDSSVLNALHAINALVPNMLNAVTTGHVDEIGPLLHEHWVNKTRLGSSVTNSRVDALYKLAREAGADGGKLLGGGGGGFLLLSSRPGRSDDIREAMHGQGVIELTFGLDHTGSCVTELAL